MPRFIELNQSQHDSGIQDYHITVNVDHIVTFNSFRYNSGKVVTTIVFDNGYKIEVTDTYRDIQERISRIKL
jgi:hypothetical protein